MRNLAFLRPLLHDGFCLFPRYRGALRRWFGRRDLGKLERLEDYMLNDIGLTRADLRDLARLPRGADMAAEFERRRDARAAAAHENES